MKNIKYLLGLVFILGVFNARAQKAELWNNKQCAVVLTYDDAINADLAEFNKTGQDKATPTFFINGVYLPNSSLVDPQTGVPTPEKITQTIQAEIAKKHQ